MYTVISVNIDSLRANTSEFDPFVANWSAIFPFLGSCTSLLTNTSLLTYSNMHVWVSDLV